MHNINQKHRYHYAMFTCSEGARCPLCLHSRSRSRVYACVSVNVSVIVFVYICIYTLFGSIRCTNTLVNSVMFLLDFECHWPLPSRMPVNNWLLFVWSTVERTNILDILTGFCRVLLAYQLRHLQKPMDKQCAIIKPILWKHNASLGTKSIVMRITHNIANYETKIKQKQLIELDWIYIATHKHTSRLQIIVARCHSSFHALIAARRRC